MPSSLGPVASIDVASRPSAHGAASASGVCAIAPVKWHASSRFSTAGIGRRGRTEVLTKWSDDCRPVNDGDASKWSHAPVPERLQRVVEDDQGGRRRRCEHFEAALSGRDLAALRGSYRHKPAQRHQAGLTGFREARASRLIHSDSPARNLRVTGDSAGAALWSGSIVVRCPCPPPGRSAHRLAHVASSGVRGEQRWGSGVRKSRLAAPSPTQSDAAPRRLRNGTLTGRVSRLRVLQDYDYCGYPLQMA